MQITVIGIATVINGSLALFKYQEKWNQYRKSAETLKTEATLYINMATTTYEDEKKKDKSFVINIEKIASNANKKVNDIQVKTPSEDSPKGLVPAGPSEGSPKGKIKYTNSVMEYKKEYEPESEYVQAKDNETEVDPGTYNVRFRAMGGREASSAVKVIVPIKKS